MFKTKKIKKQKYNRNIEDAPFYNFKYEFDELPLDPAKPFILDQINYLKRMKSIEFVSDLDLLPTTNATNFDIEDLVIPSVVENIKHHNDFPNLTNDNLYFYTSNEVQSGDYMIWKITTELTTMYRKRRQKLCRETFQKLMVKFRDFKSKPYNGKACKKRRELIICGDETKHRTSEEIKAELKRIANVIEILIAPDIERYNKGITEKPLATKKCGSISTAKQKERMQLLDNKQKILYQTPLQPNEIEYQKNMILQRYNKEFEKQKELFTNPHYRFKDRSLKLITRISVEHIQSYPSCLIFQILRRIDRSRPYLAKAFKFIQEELKHWPNVRIEVIFLDFLFHPANEVPRNEATLLIVLLLDLQEDFRLAVKRDFLKYLLSFEYEKKLLWLEMEPPEFPIMNMRAPVAWKCSVHVAKNSLEEILMTTHPVLQAISMLWRQLYYDVVVVNTSKFFSDNIPFHADKVSEYLKQSCIVTRDVLINDWLPRVADIIDVMRPYWKNLVSMKNPECGRGVYLFNCIHSLMSHQLTHLIRNSINEFYNVLSAYGDGNCNIERIRIKKPPFMTISVSVVGKSYSNFEHGLDRLESRLYVVDRDDPMLSIDEYYPELSYGVEMDKEKNAAKFVLDNSGKMYIDPYMDDLESLFVDYFKQILRVGYKIPRIEYFMSQDENERGYLHTLKEDHVDMVKIYSEVIEIVKKNLLGPTVYLYPIYEYYFPLLAGKLKMVTELIFSQKHVPELHTIYHLMDKLNQLLSGITSLQDFVPLNLFMLDNRNVNRTLGGLVNEIKHFIVHYFATLNQVENRRLCDEFEDMSLHAGERPKETPEVVALQNYLNECRDERLYKLKGEIKNVVAPRLMFLLSYTILDTEDITLNARTFLWPAELDQVLDLSAARLNVVREGLEEALRERRLVFEKFVEQESKTMEQFRLKTIREVLSIDDLKEKVNIVDELMDICEKCSREAAFIINEETLLQMDITSFPVLINMIDKMEAIEKLWRTAYQFEICYENWYFGPFSGLDARLIQEEVDNMWKTVVKLIKMLIGNSGAKRVAEQMRLKIDKFKNYLPILDAICRQGMSQRHWDQLSEVLGQPINPKLFPTLNSMIEIGIMNNLEELMTISMAAGKEFELRTQLLEMQFEWQDVSFELNPYRDSDTFILAALDEVQTLLDDHILKSQAMRGSPYIVALGSFATDWEEKLILMQDILDVWVQVQSTWMYLEPIFSSEDIMKQMPTEGRNFRNVDRIFRKVMKYTANDRRVIQATDYPNLLKQLRQSFDDLEDIQKGLNMYLEKKRLFFARFFFLSNDELLEILSETKDAQRVQPHLKKCFEGIHFLEFDQNAEVVGMISAENEVVQLTRKINPNASNGLVEKWLKEVLLVMFDSVKAQLRRGYERYLTVPRATWVLNHPGQIVLGVSCITWTDEVEEAIVGSVLPEYKTKCDSQIMELLEHVRGTLRPNMSITIEALIVLDVHARDIVQMLVEKKVDKKDDFNWLAQLRYYWKIDQTDKQDYVAVCMVATEIKYGMEYLGNQPRLVVTPLTDRCYRTLMGAIKVNLGGAPEGPAGTGKTETSKDLAKAVAKKCVVFNCSSSLDYKALGKFLKGLAQSGAWACFDEFNRMELEVLSVIAQQILTIQRAIARRLVRFMFEDTILQLDPTCTIFITMNPGYAGRTELPDNLKVLFRTVAMMVPDYAMIGEISLYSCGFEEARNLAQKIVHTYKLCSEQLSSQSHYDYGMRAIKSVLLASANLRKLYTFLPEKDIVLRAIIDVNLPKFLQEDIQLFEGIYKDLFPGIEVYQPQREDIMKHLLKKIETKRLQPTPWYLEKVMQIYEMMLVRHGVMVVGGAMGGKTTAYQLLAECLKAVQTDTSATLREQGANYRIINPKAIDIGQLYGSFDPVSHEWSDGVLAKTFRDMVNTTTGERQWIMFDGPVDAVWIENLNTTLDDNKKLCLMSGEIIQMTNLMTLFFEPADLEQASPATISRVGMIYMEPTQLGWKTYHKSFVDDLLDSNINDIYLGLYEMLVDWLVQPLIEMIDDCQCVLKLAAMHCYRMLTRFFMHFYLTVENLNQIWFQQTFLFCVLWSFGSTVTVESRKTVDVLFRKILYGNNEELPKPKNFSLNRGQIFPEKMTVFDYRFDGIENWWPWAKSDDVKLPDDIAMSDIMVPVKESACISYWMNVCLLKNQPLLVIGPTGTGKSATVQNVMFELPKTKFLLNIINFSARTSANQVQDIIMSKLDRRRKGVFGPPVGKQCLVFVDDIGMPARDEYGSQPPLELLRQWIDHKHWSDLIDTTKIEVQDMQIASAMGLVGGSNYIYPRLYRHMFVIGVDAFEDSTIYRIFSAISEWHFKNDFDESVSKHVRNICSATIEIFRAAAENFLPTPTKSHYVFSLRDMTRVFQGLILVPAKRLPTQEKLGRLWTHEIYRVFCDRLNDPADRKILMDVVTKSCYTHLRFPLEQAFSLEKNEHVNEMHVRDLMFGNYGEPDAYPKVYDEIEDLNKLEKTMNFYLSEYNMISTSPMHLVLFRFAIEHISRISRILQMPKGNILMVGLGGSGRRSAVKLAASMADIDLFQIEIDKNYGLNEWRDDIRKLLLKAGINAKPTVFLFCDSQAKDELFIEDINCLLNTAELTNLFQQDDKVIIIEQMQNAAKMLEKQIESTPIALYNFFIERVREYLHIALAFSPIGDIFKQRLRMFPSLINCCTIDWFTTWPVDALERVAVNFVKTMDVNKAKREEMVEKEIELDKTDDPEDLKKEVDRQLDNIELKLVDIILKINTIIVRENEHFYLELGRRNYITPTSYLEMLRSFQTLFEKKYGDIIQLRDRYTIGLEKLEYAAGQVAIMQENLYALQPQLKVTSEETEKMMVHIERETAEAERKKEVVGADEAAANDAAAAAQAIKDDCESDLQEAIPAMEAALSALDTLKPADITVVKSMKNPPGGVKLVLEAVCVIKGFKPDRKPDATGRMVEDYWGPSVRMLGDMKFLESLKTFDKDNIPPAVMKKIRDVYIADRDFVPEIIKNTSMACEGLCRWVRAMDVYDRVAKIVAPKKMALADAENELQAQMEKLNEKKAELQVILNKLQKLNDAFAEKSKEKKNLEDEIDNCEKKLVRAEKLLGGLGGEKKRWSETASVLDGSLVNVVGDVLIAAGCVAYLGCYTTLYRKNIIQEWNNICLEMEIPCSETFSLIKTLGNDIEIRSWTIAGLPVDNFSIENGIIVSNARKWPLMIDPQVQANKWIKTMEKDNNLKVFKLTDDNYMRMLENAVKTGLPVLLENIGESIDFGLFPILEKNILKQHGGLFIKFGDGLIEYNENFRFYITTCLANPHYLPETAVMVTILNFMITPEGLREQLLTTVVVQERPDLQERKEQLIIESARNRVTLFNVETKILQVLSSSEGNILEDENAINILTSSKILSEEIMSKQAISDVTEKEIDSARQLYIPVSFYSAVLFFCLTELPEIDPMYHFSQMWFMNLFVQTILKAPKSTVLEERLQNLNAYFTKSIYENVCRSLFERDKLIFAFSMCIGILRSTNAIADGHLTYLLQGNLNIENPIANPALDWLTEKAWSEIVGASQLEGLENLHNHIEKDLAIWKAFYDTEDPASEAIPKPFTNVSDVLKLIILRCLRPDKIVPTIRAFISKNMGRTFVEPPPFNLSNSYDDSNPITPLIFLLSPGADPVTNIFAFSREKGIYDKTKQMSLGQGQGPKAMKMLADGIKQGHWIILQNIHVAESWMSTFEKFCNDLLLMEGVNTNFRLWCTSYPSQIFPVSVLQNSVKMTNEPPKGLKLNMMKLLNSDPLAIDKFFSHAFYGETQKNWFRGVFCLLFFHCIAQGRKDFGPLGFNIPYEFNDSDLKISLMQLKMLLKQYGNIPFEGHSYLTGECNYGGRVTDDKDRRCLVTLLEDVYNDTTVSQDNYSFNENKAYYVPLVPNRTNCLEYISTLPDVPTPEVFGLHENADIVKNVTECYSLFSGTLKTQAELKTSAKRSGDATDATNDPILILTDTILERLPQIYKLKLIAAKYPITYSNSMNTVLRQEAVRFNKLIGILKHSLAEIRRAILGQIAMIPELENLYNSLRLGRIPKVWASKSYPSLKPLGSYVNDLVARLAFFQNWIDNGEPACFWISGFYFTQSFLTAVLQNFSRRQKIQIDAIEIDFQVTDFEDEIGTSGELTYFTKGLFLEGARWNRESHELDEALQRILFDILPVIQMTPKLRPENPQQSNKIYNCPVYKTSERRGTLSTTGHSTNFVMMIQLNTSKSPQHWIKRGTASLLQLDN